MNFDWQKLKPGDILHTDSCSGPYLFIGYVDWICFGGGDISLTRLNSRQYFKGANAVLVWDISTNRLSGFTLSVHQDRPVYISKSKLLALELGEKSNEF